MERRSTWWAGNHGGEGMGGDFDVESQVNFVLRGRSLSPATRRPVSSFRRAAGFEYYEKLE